MTAYLFIIFFFLSVSQLYQTFYFIFSRCAIIGLAVYVKILHIASVHIARSKDATKDAIDANPPWNISSVASPIPRCPAGLWTARIPRHRQRTDNNPETRLQDNDRGIWRIALLESIFYNQYRPLPPPPRRVVLLQIPEILYIIVCPGIQLT